MAARQARHNVKLFSSAYLELAKYRRDLAARIGRDVTYSAALEHAILRARGADELSDERNEGGQP